MSARKPLLGPILGSGPTSPGLSATSWAHLGNKSRPFGNFLGPSWGWGKQVQAFRPLLGPILGRGKQAQAFRPLLGPILGGGANKSRPFGHFLGPSWVDFRPLLGPIQTSPGLSANSWAHLGQTSPSPSATSWAHLGGRGKQVQAFRPLLGPILGGGANKPGPSATSWAHLGGRGQQVQAFRPLLGPSWPILGVGQIGHFLGPSWGAVQTSPGLSATSWAHRGPSWGGGGGANNFLSPSATSCLSATSWAILGGRGKQVQAFRPLLGPILRGAEQTSPGLSATSWAHLGVLGRTLQAFLCGQGFGSLGFRGIKG